MLASGLPDRAAAAGPQMPRPSLVPSDPVTLVALLCVGQIAGWTLAPALVHSAPGLDVVESYMWGREWLIGTYKHPALPSWVLELSLLVTGGAAGWPAYLASQLFVAATYLLVFLLGRDLMGPERAAAGTLLLVGVAYYAWPTPEFNHNIAEMPFWAGVAWALWRAVERRAAGWWMLAGAIAAGGLYAKLSTAVLLAAAAGWLLLDRKARPALATAGPWIGLATFAVIAAPIALWLLGDAGEPPAYAAHRAAGANTGLTQFAVSSLLNIAGLPAMVALAGLGSERLMPPMARGAISLAPLSDGMHYLVWLTVGPPALTLAGAIAAGAGLRSAWGSSMFNLLGLMVVGMAGRQFPPLALRRIALCAAALLVLLPAVYAAVIWANARGPFTPMRVTWPQAEIAERLSGAWAEATGRPLRIVTGDDWVAGLVGLTARDRPSILNQGNFAHSPWITPERLAAEGALVVWDPSRTDRLSKATKARISSVPASEVRFAWPHAKDRADLVIAYAIVAPRPLPGSGG